MHFNYIAKSKTGERVSGIIEASDKVAAIRAVEKRGYVPIAIHPANGTLPEARAATNSQTQDHSAKTTSPLRRKTEVVAGVCVGLLYCIGSLILAGIDSFIESFFFIFLAALFMGFMTYVLVRSFYSQKWRWLAKAAMSVGVLAGGGLVIIFEKGAHSNGFERFLFPLIVLIPLTFFIFIFFFFLWYLKRLFIAVISIVLQRGHICQGALDSHNSKKMTVLMAEIIEVSRAQLNAKLIRLLIGVTLFTPAAIAAFVFTGRAVADGASNTLLLRYAMGTFSGSAIVCLVMALLSLKKLMTPISLGAKSPEELLWRFYERSLGTDVEASAMFMLHPSAIEAIGGVLGFGEHWGDSNRQVLQYLRRVCTEVTSGFSCDKVTLLNPATLITAHGNGGLYRCRASLTLQAEYSKDDAGSEKQAPEGIYLFHVEHEMKKEAGRWFLADAHWHGQPAQ